jgi:hypothetical protein
LGAALEILIIILLGIIALAVAPELTLLVFIGIPLLCIAGLVAIIFLPSLLSALPTLLFGGALLVVLVGGPMATIMFLNSRLHRRWRERIDQTWNTGGREKLMKHLRGMSPEQIESQLGVSDWPNWREAVAAEMARRKSNEERARAARARFWARLSEWMARRKPT